MVQFMSCLLPDQFSKAMIIQQNFDETLSMNGDGSIVGCSLIHQIEDGKFGNNT
jgi:hypothetical protein